MVYSPHQLVVNAAGPLRHQAEARQVLPLAGELFGHVDRPGTAVPP
jgi:hypothetical protein